MQYLKFKEQYEENPDQMDINDIQQIKNLFFINVSQQIILVLREEIEFFVVPALNICSSEKEVNPTNSIINLSNKELCTIEFMKQIKNVCCQYIEEKKKILSKYSEENNTSTTTNDADEYKPKQKRNQPILNTLQLLTNIQSASEWGYREREFDKSRINSVAMLVVEIPNNNLRYNMDNTMDNDYGKETTIDDVYGNNDDNVGNNEYIRENQEAIIINENIDSTNSYTPIENESCIVNNESETNHGENKITNTNSMNNHNNEILDKNDKIIDSTQEQITNSVINSNDNLKGPINNKNINCVNNESVSTNNELDTTDNHIYNKNSSIINNCKGNNNENKVEKNKPILRKSKSENINVYNNGILKKPSLILYSNDNIKRSSLSIDQNINNENGILNKSLLKDGNIIKKSSVSSLKANCLKLEKEYNLNESLRNTRSDSVLKKIHFSCENTNNNEANYTTHDNKEHTIDRKIKKEDSIESIIENIENTELDINNIDNIENKFEDVDNTHNLEESSIIIHNSMHEIVNNKYEDSIHIINYIHDELADVSLDNNEGNMSSENNNSANILGQEFNSTNLENEIVSIVVPSNDKQVISTTESLSKERGDGNISNEYITTNNNNFGEGGIIYDPTESDQSTDINITDSSYSDDVTNEIIVSELSNMVTQVPSEQNYEAEVVNNEDISLLQPSRNCWWESISLHLELPENLYQLNEDLNLSYSDIKLSIIQSENIKEQNYNIDNKNIYLGFMDVKLWLRRTWTIEYCAI